MRYKTIFPPQQTITVIFRHQIFGLKQGMHHLEPFLSFFHDLVESFESKNCLSTSKASEARECPKVIPDKKCNNMQTTAWRYVSLSLPSEHRCHFEIRSSNTHWNAVSFKEFSVLIKLGFACVPASHKRVSRKTCPHTEPNRGAKDPSCWLLFLFGFCVLRFSPLRCHIAISDKPTSE